IGITPIPGVTPPLNIVTVNNSAGHQYNPHVSGDLVAYTDGLSPSSIRYFRFSTGTDTIVPLGNSFTDGLSDVSAGRITFSRILQDRHAIMVFDPSTSTLTEIDPQIGSNRLGSAIGANTVAYVDYRSSGLGDIVVFDLATMGPALTLSTS